MNATEVAAVHYACRRGMLELDLMLERFFSETFALLSDSEKHQFKQLLAESDQQLWEWLRGDEYPKQPEFAHLVDLIRHVSSTTASDL